MKTFLSFHIRNIRVWRRRLLNSRFFTISCLIHLVLVVTLGGTVLVQRYVEPPDFTAGDGGGFLEGTSINPAPQPQAPTDTQVETFQVQTQAADATNITAITTSAPTQTAFTMPTIIAPTINPNATNLAQNAAPTAAPINASGMSREIAAGIKGFSSGWGKGGSGGYGTSMKAREFEFTAYLAKYSGGNWASTVRIQNNKIVAGSLPNLLYVIGKLSRDKIKANPQAIPLDLSNEAEIMAKRPPFILFTGHRDFTLTPKEVEVLQKYIRLGGCIWGDSSLPGLRSRFDIAFRREMRRVIPDTDKDWVQIPETHAIFTKPYYPEIRAVPPGLNFYKEPLFALTYYDEIAILYTPNSYGDMWQFGLNAKWEFETGRDVNGQYVAMNSALFDRRDTYFRNITPEAVKATYQFGTNIIVHLLTRWEDKVRNVPSSL